MGIDVKTIKKMSELAALFVENEELEDYAKELDLIIGYMSELKELDTGGTKPIEHVLPLCNVFREDIITSSDNRHELMKNAPESENGFYRVPMVVEYL